MVADQLSFVAFAWLALQLTGSPLTVGTVLTAAAVPRGVLTVVGGTVADRIGARRLALLASIARVLVMGFLSALVLTHAVRLWEVVALSLLFGLGDAFYAPARGSLMPRIIPPEQFDAANSLTSTSQALAQLGGPALAGLLVARAGTGYALAGDALCFAIVAISTAALRVAPLEPTTRQAPASILAELVEGIRYVFGDPGIRTLMLLGAAMNFAATGPIDVGLAALARERLGGAGGLGVMLAAFGGGSLVGILLAGVIRGGRMLPRLVGAAFVFGALMPLLGIVPALPEAIALILVMGMAAGAVSVVAASWVMRRTEARMMGRLVGVLSLTSTGMVPFSMAASGAVAQVSVPLLMAAGGAVMLLAGIAGVANRTVRSS